MKIVLMLMFMFPAVVFAGDWHVVCRNTDDKSQYLYVCEDHRGLYLRKKGYYLEPLVASDGSNFESLHHDVRVKDEYGDYTLLSEDNAYTMRCGTHQVGLCR